MPEKKLCAEIKSHTIKAEIEKCATEVVIDPLIRKIQQRNHRTKLAMANKLLALGLKRKSLESILHIRL